MPKIIPELQEKILEKSEDLFEKSSYSEIDMRKIAAECNIAVGTLYNYFPNKQKLFVNIFQRSWQKTIEKLKCAATDNKAVDERCREFFSILYKDIVYRKGIGKEVFERELIVKEKDKMLILKEVFEKIFCQVHEILISLLSEAALDKELTVSSKELRRLAINSIFSLHGMIMFFKNDEVENIDFVLKTIFYHLECLKNY